MATVLVVDDVEENRLLLEYSLEDDGHVVWSESGGVAALERVKKELPDIIFLDINMPEMDGIEVLQILKSDEKLQEIPVIMVTGDDREEGVIRALDLGAYDYVTKPYSFPILAARLRSSLRLKRMQDSLRRTNQRLSVMSTTDLLTALYNRRHFLELSSKEIAKAKKFDRPLMVAVIGVDNLKVVNDEYGTTWGDKILIQLGKILKNEFKHAEIIGRLSGGDFGLCLPDTTREDAHKIVEHIRATMESENLDLGVVHDNNSLVTTVSVGLTRLEAEDEDLTSILRRADVAMHLAKKAGCNQICDTDQSRTLESQKKASVDAPQTQDASVEIIVEEAQTTGEAGDLGDIENLKVFERKMTSNDIDDLLKGAGKE